MEIQQVVSGFRLVEERQVPETNSLGRLFVHEKSGARLLQLANDDSNKVFGIGFRTPSSNSTGPQGLVDVIDTDSAFNKAGITRITPADLFAVIDQR